MIDRMGFCAIKVEAPDKPGGFVMVPIMADGVHQPEQIALLNGYRLNARGDMYTRPPDGFVSSAYDVGVFLRETSE